MMKNRLFILSLIVLLSGCVKNYKVKPLKNIKKNEAEFIEKKEGIEIRARRIKRKELGALFRSSLSDQQVQGFLLTLNNQSNQKVYLDHKNINVPMVSTKELYQSLSKYSAVCLGLGLGGAAMLGLTAASLCTIPFVLIPGIVGTLGLITIIGTALATPIVFLGGSFTGIDAAVFNQKLKKELNDHIVSSFSIRPGKKHSALFVTREKFKSFEILLVKGKSEQLIVFRIDLKNGQ